MGQCEGDQGAGDVEVQGVPGAVAYAGRLCVEEEAVCAVQQRRVCRRACVPEGAYVHEEAVPGGADRLAWFCRAGAGAEHCAVPAAAPPPVPGVYGGARAGSTQAAWSSAEHS